MTLNDLFPLIDPKLMKWNDFVDLINTLDRNEIDIDRDDVLSAMYGGDDLEEERVRAEIARIEAQTKRELAAARRLDRE